MSFNSPGLSLAELRSKITELNAELDRRHVQEREQFVSKVREQAAMLDIPLAEVARALRSGSRSTGKRGKVQAKYRNIHNHSETWSGRGRKPRWVVDHLAAGGSMEGITI